MPRDIPVGNGRLLVTFDDRYQIRDLYYPHVGQENHAGAGPCRFGLWTKSDEFPRGKTVWTGDKSWRVSQRYLRDTLTTSVNLEHDGLALTAYCNEVVDFHRPVFVRKMKIKNHLSRDRVVKVFHQNDFNMFGTKIGDTAYFDPELRGMVHYRAKRYLMATFFASGEQRVDEFACGTSGFGGAEGTWRDAEDGHLQGNAIAQGAVDSTMALHVNVPADGERTVYMVLMAGESRDELIALHKWLHKQTPQGVIDRTTSYWRLWSGGTNINFGNLPPKVVEMFKRSLLVVRTQIDHDGAIIAANDSDIMQFARDTYSYMWPRDGALVADSLDLAGFSDLARNFYSFCQRTITPDGYFYHKYNPDGSPASSWHPWVIKGQQSLPIQEDETALVVWALWRHYFRYRDIEFIRPMWVDVVQKAADFMCDYRDERTGLPLPSYDLWEERWGVHAFTVATVYGGLVAARNFAVCFGDRERAERYKQAADEIRAGAAKYLWSEKLGHFARRLVPKDNPTPPMDAEYHEAEGARLSPDPEDIYEVDEVLDASVWAVYKFHLFEADDPRVVATMNAVETRLWVKTKVGGVARYENDYYHRISDDIKNVPGNPWFICTLWLADYFITRAKTPEELKLALPIFEWTAGHALESGVLAEQVNPYTNEPISVSPLTWSHATVVSTSIKYLEKLESLQSCDSCGQPIFRLRRPGTVEMKSHGYFDRYGADFEGADPPTLNGAASGTPNGSPHRETAAVTGTFPAADPATGRPVSATLAIDQRDCIGCGVCISHCDPGVLKPLDGKAVIDLRALNRCDLNGACVEVCPTKVVSLVTDPAAAEAERADREVA